MFQKLNDSVKWSKNNLAGHYIKKVNNIGVTLTPSIESKAQIFSVNFFIFQSI